MDNDLKKWAVLVETYSTLHAKDTEEITTPEPASDEISDKVCIDITLLIKLMEYAREDAPDADSLHRVAELCIKKNKHKDSLTMGDYDDIISVPGEPKKEYTQ